MLLELPPEQYSPSGSVDGEKLDHLLGRGMGPLSIVCYIGEDHPQMESSCDVGGQSIPGRPSMEKYIAVRLASRLDVIL